MLLFVGFNVFISPSSLALRPYGFWFFFSHQSSCVSPSTCVARDFRSRACTMQTMGRLLCLHVSCGSTLGFGRSLRSVCLCIINILLTGLLTIACRGAESAVGCRKFCREQYTEIACPHPIYVSPIARIMFVICFAYMYVRAFRSLASFTSCYFRARCAYNLCAKDLLCAEAGKIPLHLLRNGCLPEHTLPRTYDLELYSQVILYLKGLTSCWSLSEVYVSLVSFGSAWQEVEQTKKRGRVHTTMVPDSRITFSTPPSKTRKSPSDFCLAILPFLFRGDHH
ncbi:hypothetical protein DFJ58DRAFT_189092 [Suillus subalutaceus]|uniref:uncharacterized protein n=1 Tax=Suillus subalutaceus TaxID=48586 RepID=UPI001B8691AE|nr:uncharacterized protein DFJ58DRAFT_189092 [Suillus subalutaceus]KAG1836164.1 hypothetical protein DFJ58DRAFT_189092 [Suillus subalutaceus]